METLKKSSGESPMATRKIKLLFLCTGNSCRSQMAEGWALKLKGDEIEAYSAGIETHGLNPHAVRVMAEAGVDISEHQSKNVFGLLQIPFDYVVTVCDHAQETCPLFPGKARVLHVGFDDPPKLAKEARSEEEALRHYRRVRDEIRAFVETLPDALTQVKEPGSWRAKRGKPRRVVMDETVKELIAIGASVGAHCQPCLEYHLKKAREIGIDLEDVRQAVEIGHRVEKGSMAAMKKFSSNGLEKYALPADRDDPSAEEA